MRLNLLIVLRPAERSRSPVAATPTSPPSRRPGWTRDGTEADARYGDELEFTFDGVRRHWRQSTPAPGRSGVKTGY